jgi:hypothetical protein
MYPESLDVSNRLGKTPLEEVTSSSNYTDEARADIEAQREALRLE